MTRLLSINLKQGVSDFLLNNTLVNGRRDNCSYLRVVNRNRCFIKLCVECRIWNTVTKKIIIKRKI